MKSRANLATYFLTCTLSALLWAQAPSSKVETGSVGGAAFRIEIPANWNKGLVMFAHGYTQPPGYAGDNEPPPVQQYRNVFVSRGFAFAESAYRYESSLEVNGLHVGWAIKEGLNDTEALRRHFVSVHGKPEKTFIVGESMGAVITIGTIERHPNEYNGALPMCGPIAGTTEFLNYGILDVLATFDYFFPNILGSPFEVNPQLVQKARAAFEAEPAKAAAWANQMKRRLQTLPGNIGQYQQIATELSHRAGGNPFDNSNRLYKGFDDDVALNRGIKRYTADPVAREYVRQYYSPTGRIADPVLALTVTGDNLVPSDWVTGYELLAVRQGTQDKFLARFTEGQGHCGYSRDQMGHAFDALVQWERNGTRPAAGEQK